MDKYTGREIEDKVYKMRIKMCDYLDTMSIHPNPLHFELWTSDDIGSPVFHNFSEVIMEFLRVNDDGGKEAVDKLIVGVTMYRYGNIVFEHIVDQKEMQE